MPEIDEILVSVGPGESRFALIGAGRPVEFLIDRGDCAAGDIVLGRVTLVNKGLDACFIDIGDRQPGFLAPPESLSEGDQLLVQVVSGARAGKGAKLSRTLSVGGRYLTYTPKRSALNPAPCQDENALPFCLPPGLRPGQSTADGFVIRTAATKAAEAEIVAEAELVRSRWRSMLRAVAKRAAPARLYSPSPLSRLLDLYPHVQRVRVDEPAALAEARRLFPQAELQRDAFDVYDTADILEQALDPRVPLPGGGWLIIEAAAGATVVDIDSGSGSPLAANRAAMPEMLRQFRLRGVRGHILVDVVPLRDRGALASLVGALQDAVADDPTPTKVVGTTPLGMIEMTRAQRGPTLAEMMLVTPAPRRNDETVGLEGLRALVRATIDRPGAVLALAAAPAVIAQLRTRAATLDEVAKKLGRAPRLVEDPGVALFDLVEEPR